MNPQYNEILYDFYQLVVVSKSVGMDIAIMSTVRNDAYIKAFGEHLRKLRTDRGLTCEKLEGLTNIDFRQISRLERGERSPTISTMLVLAKGLGIEPYELLQFEFKG